MKMARCAWRNGLLVFPVLLATMITSSPAALACEPGNVPGFVWDTYFVVVPEGGIVVVGTPTDSCLSDSSTEVLNDCLWVNTYSSQAVAVQWYLLPCTPTQ